jgi:type IV pilus assembly protein PilY1
MDDSGSMDWEVLLDTASGQLWWNTTSFTAWNSSTGKPLRTSSAKPYSYLFPVGSATGGQLYSYSSDYGKALPPTNQFAWMRSSRFNPLYYDTSVTYAPWSPAYVDGAVQAYASSTASSAWAHPAYTSGPTLDLTADWSSSNGNFANRNDEYTFYFQKGMAVPGSGITIASDAGNCPLGGIATGACYAGVRYYPATYWQAETCNVDVDCVLAPDGVTTLKRYEIKDGNSFPSGRSYANEIQNFANWFSYFRKRKLMLAASMGSVLEDLTGMRIGLMKFTDETASTPTVTMYDTENTNANSNGRRVAGAFYKNALAAEGTPTHATVKHIAKQFNENTSIVQYACQRNSMFIVTDGFSNTTTITPPDWDAGKSADTWGADAPYQTTADGTLADLAWRYYTNRLRSGLAAGKVPPSSSSAPNADSNIDLHINTYAISLGVRGSLWPTECRPLRHRTDLDRRRWPTTRR